MGMNFEPNVCSYDAGATPIENPLPPSTPIRQ